MMMTSAETSAISVETEKDLRSPYYCEENVWRLAFRRQFHRSREKLYAEHDSTDWVVFISNPQRCCPMLYQMASPEPSQQPCCWDYHVILLTISQGEENTVMVFDLDTTLPFPCDLHTYITHSFHETYLHPLFRIISANQYIQNFYSDRMHMFCLEKNKWSAEPPSYSSVMNGHLQGSNLHLFTTMESKDVIHAGDILIQDISSPNAQILMAKVTTSFGVVVEIDGLVALVSHFFKFFSTAKSTCF